MFKSISEIMQIVCLFPLPVSISINYLIFMRYNKQALSFNLLFIEKKPKN